LVLQAQKSYEEKYDTAIVNSVVPLRCKPKIADLPLVKSMRDLEILREKYGAEAEYLPNAVPGYHSAAGKADPGEFREKFWDKAGEVFLLIGRTHRLEGLHVLVRVLKYVEEDIVAVFVEPDGEYLKETLDLAEKLSVGGRVYMLGYVAEKTKIQVLDSAIALVLPSTADYVEVYPMVISEAWARERPIMASRIGGIPYRVKQGVNGILVDPSDLKVLAEAMLKVAVMTSWLIR